jgi:hypothetical protein
VRGGAAERRGLVFRPALSVFGRLGAAGALLLVASVPIRADGPHIAFHAVEGSYAVTVFTAPDPLVAGPAEMTLLVQSAGDGSLLRGAGGNGALTLPGRVPVRFLFAPGAPGKALPLADVVLAAPGTYGLTLRVRVSGTAAVDFKGVLPVEANHGKRTTVLWAVFLPLLGVGLFLANQQGKRRMRQPRRAG